MHASARQPFGIASQEETCNLINMRLEYLSDYRIINAKKFSREYLAQSLRRAVHSGTALTPAEICRIFHGCLRSFSVEVCGPTPEGDRFVSLDVQGFNYPQTLSVLAGESLHETLAEVLGFEDFGLILCSLGLPLTGHGADGPDVIPVPEMATA